MSLPGKLLIDFLKLFPYVKGLESRIHNYEKHSSFVPGHYYSPLVNTAEYIEQTKHTAGDLTFPEIDFNEAGQLALLKELKSYYHELPFSEEPSGDLRYYYKNDFFSYSDAITLFCMIRKFRPSRLIEIGSGFSSALILDTNEKFCNSTIELTFIDPYPERLKGLLKERDKVNIINKKIQEVDPDVFKTLKEGDFLLIDTSHVSKSGSDVNHIYFNILPLLNKGVQIHIHDIFFPFEYPQKWIVDEKRSWNELYLLHGLLAYTNAFEITYFNSFMEEKYNKYFVSNMPLFLKRSNTICGGMWIKKAI